jgi:hypothetical protein
MIDPFQLSNDNGLIKQLDRRPTLSLIEAAAGNLDLLHLMYCNDKAT